MQSIDRKINGIREQFRAELKTGILSIVNRLNERYLKLADAKKDEFESEAEFKARIAKEKSALDTEQAGGFTAFQDRLEKEYNQQITPFIAELRKLSGQEFTITAENLILDLGTYDGVSNTYPVSIKAKKPLEILRSEVRQLSNTVLSEAPRKKAAKKAKRGTIPASSQATFAEQSSDKVKYVMVAANANIPIPRDEAREFKQHFVNNMLRPEIRGNFETPDIFLVAQAYVIDDATAKKYDLFTAEYIDLENGTVYDSVNKLLWSKNAQFFEGVIARGGLSHKLSGAEKKAVFEKALDEIISKFELSGLRGWRVPTISEISKMASLSNKSHPFVNTTGARFSGGGCSDVGFLAKKDAYYSGGTVDGYVVYSIDRNQTNRLCSNPRPVIWPVRGAAGL
jgi:hypothetical protein